MKNSKKYFQIFVPLLILTMLLSGAPWQPVEAYSTSATWAQNQNQIRNLNQMRIQDMTLEHRHEMLQLLIQLHALLRQMDRLQDQSYLGSEVQVATRSAIDIEENEAVLRGWVVDFNDSDYADVWFELDTDRSDLDQKTNTERIMSDEDNEFEKRVTGLKEDTTYYFRAVGEDDEEELDYGTVLNFRTDGEQEDGPDVTTSSAADITDDSAILRGSVDMNDVRNGKVFFVYGEDQGLVEDVEDDYSTYADVVEYGEDLQKVLVDNDLDDASLYEVEVMSLDSNTDMYFNLCVAYEDEDNDDVITCDSVRSFTTD